MDHLKLIIEKAWDDRSLLNTNETKETVFQIVEYLDKGILRVAEPVGSEWKVNE